MIKKQRLFIIIILALILLLTWVFKDAIFKIISLLITSSIISYIIYPFIKSIEKRVPLSIGIVIGFSIIIFSIVALIMLLVPIFKEQIITLTDVLPQYIQKITEQISQVPFLKDFLPSFSNLKEKFLNFEMVIEVFSPQKLISIISSSLLIPLIVFYMIKERDKIKKYSLFLLPGKMRTPAIYIFKDINRQLRDYVMGEFIIILTVSCLMSFVLFAFRFDYWLILGIIMGIFNIIPYIGPIIGSLPILFTAFYQEKIILALILIILIQQIDNLIIHPRIISDSVKIHPVAVLLCVVAGSSIGSILGMVLAIPLFIIFRILFREFYKYFSERKRNFLQFDKI